MNFKAHLILGTVTALTSAYYLKENNFDSENILISIPLILCGSLFPDIDTNSIPSRIFATTGFLTALFFLLSQRPDYSAYIGLFFMLCKLGKHRGWTHKYWIPAVFFASSILIPNYSVIFASIAIGFICHFIADSLFPWKIKNWF